MTTKIVQLFVNIIILNIFVGCATHRQVGNPVPVLIKTNGEPAITTIVGDPVKRSIADKGPLFKGHRYAQKDLQFQLERAQSAVEAEAIIRDFMASKGLPYTPGTFWPPQQQAPTIVNQQVGSSASGWNGGGFGGNFQSSGNGVAPSPGYSTPGLGNNIAPSPGYSTPGLGNNIAPSPGYSTPGLGNNIAPSPGYSTPGAGNNVAPSPGYSTPGSGNNVAPSPGYSTPGGGNGVAPSPGYSPRSQNSTVPQGVIGTAKAFFTGFWDLGKPARNSEGGVSAYAFAGSSGRQVSLGGTVDRFQQKLLDSRSGPGLIDTGGVPATLVKTTTVNLNVAGIAGANSGLTFTGR